MSPSSSLRAQLNRLTLELGGSSALVEGGERLIKKFQNEFGQNIIFPKYNQVEFQELKNHKYNVLPPY